MLVHGQRSHHGLGGAHGSTLGDIRGNACVSCAIWMTDGVGGRALGVCGCGLYSTCGESARLLCGVDLGSNIPYNGGVPYSALGMLWHYRTF